MTSKNQETLADNISVPRKYDTNLTKNVTESSSPIEDTKRIDYNKLKIKLDGFKKKLIKKFPFVISLSILPPNASKLFAEDENMPKGDVEKNPLQLMMIIPEKQFKNLNKIKPEVIRLSQECDEMLWIHIKTSEIDLWNYGLDSKYEFLDAISASFPLYDNGLLGGVRVANIHKSLVLNWLNVGRVRYVASYVVGGSLVRGTADKESDVDTFVIIDDTDVKRMSRVELIGKLRGKIVGEFVKEASALAGVKNILNVQVWLLTDFWQRVKDAEPVAFTFIRDGVPIFDRGTFIPWKRLLQMGKIKPSPEAIDLYMKEGDRTEDMIKRRMLDAMVDIYFGIVTPTQAMMMLSGQAPPVPKVIVQEVKKVLVDKEKVMTMKELKTLEKIVKMYKDYEHGKLKSVLGNEIDKLVEESKEYGKKIKVIRKKLEKKMQEHQAEKISDTTFGLMKKIFGNKGQEALIKDFENKVIKKGKVPGRMLDIAKDVAKLKRRVKGKVLAQSEMQRASGNASDLIGSLTEYAQRKELVSLGRGIVQFTYNNGKAEIVATDHGVFVVQQDGIILKVKGKKLEESTRKNLERALSETKERLKFDLDSEMIRILNSKYDKFSILF